MAIVDRRTGKNGKGSESRRRFIDRHAKALNRKLDKFLKDHDIKDIANSDSIPVKGDISDIDIHHPSRDRSGDEMVLPGNDRFSKGDDIPVPSGGKGKGKGPGGQGDSLGEDEFEFLLTKDEFRHVLFKGMGIPFFNKKSGGGETVDTSHKAGYTKVGIPGRLLIKKTYEQAISRNLATTEDPDAEIEIDDVDLRYRNIVIRQEPIKKAVMFCIMDVSGSMGEEEKNIAKRFFLLTYLFLTTAYKAVDIIFIRYHGEAEECDEDTFFNKREYGGTVTASALRLMQQIIQERYSSGTENIYMTLCSDGDDFEPRDADLEMKASMPFLNYAAYLQVSTTSYTSHGILLQILNSLSAKAEYKGKIGVAMAHTPEEVYPCLRSLFTSKGE